MPDSPFGDKSGKSAEDRNWYFFFFFSLVADGEFLLNLELPGIIIDRFT